jgi:hypothetical protein
MPKKHRKLVLNKETIRNLNASELKQVAGGATLYTCTALDTCTCSPRTDCTYCEGCAPTTGYSDFCDTATC